MLTIHHVASLSDLAECQRLVDAIWGPFASCSVAQMSVHAKYGGVVLLARWNEEPAGFLFSFPARYMERWVLWSHETGVLPRYMHQGIGMQLKQRQRQIAAELGYAEIAWTFDPLISRNAFFNIRKLGCTVSEYKVNAYGRDETDLINRGLETDRLIAVWSTTAAAEVKAESPRAMVEGYHERLKVAPDESPVLTDHADERPRGWVTEIPRDFEKLAREDPERATSWRHTFRAVSLDLFTKGYRPTSFLVNSDKTRGRYIWTQEV